MTETTTEFGPRKTVLILAIVAGCFAMLWPKIFYPMLTASVTPPHSADNSGCCDVIFESDVTAVDIMQELCHNIIRHHQVDPRVRGVLEVNKFNKLTPSSASLCREEVLARCGIDLSSFLAEKGRLKKSYKQVLEEIRGFNGSLCLKMQFGVPLSRLGTPHLIRYHILMPHSTIRQERQTPPHAGSYHPALRERGRAIPSSHIVPRIQDRPDHVAPMKMRPPMGGAGHMVAAPKGNGSLGLLMPLYTIGIIIFFLYTISKVLMGIIMPLYTIGNVVSFLYKILQVLRKSTDSEIMRPEYSTAAAEREYQKLVFNPEVFAAAVTAVNGSPSERKERPPSPMQESPPTIDELNEHQAPKSNGLAAGVSPNLKETNFLEETCGQDEKELEEYHETVPTVKVVNMEMTTSCEGGQKCSRPTTPILLVPHGHMEEKEKSPPISIYLEGALPPQCELLVTDSKTQEVQEEGNVEVPIVLSGKMTLSLISLDQESQENDQLETEAASGITPGNEKYLSSESDESESEIVDALLSNKKIDILRKEIQDKEDQAQESYESGSEEGDEVDYEDEDEDQEDDNAEVNYKQETSRYLGRNEESLKENYNKTFSKNYISGNDNEGDDAYSDSDDGSNNEALLKMIQNEKSRILKTVLKGNQEMGESNGEEEEEEEVEDEEEEVEGEVEEMEEDEEEEEEEEEVQGIDVEIEEIEEEENAEGEEEEIEENEEEEEEEEEGEEEEDEDDEEEQEDNDEEHNKTKKIKEPIVIKNRN